MRCHWQDLARTVSILLCELQWCMHMIFIRLFDWYRKVSCVYFGRLSSTHQRSCNVCSTLVLVEWACVCLICQLDALVQAAESELFHSWTRVVMTSCAADYEWCLLGWTWFHSALLNQETLSCIYFTLPRVHLSWEVMKSKNKMLVLRYA